MSRATEHYGPMEHDAYTHVMSVLPADFPDRENLASVAGFMAAYSRNISKIARKLGRSRWWVRKRALVIAALYATADD